MDDNASKGVRRRGGKRDGKFSRLVWSTAEEEALLECLREIVRTGWKSDNGFRTGYLDVLEQLLNKACPNSRLKAEPHISSKIHVWKKTYGCINDMMVRSGFGLCQTTNTIDIKDDVFDNFAKDRATGERGFDPILAPRNPNHTAETERSENVPVTPEYYVPTPDPTLYGDDDEFMNSFASATAQPTVNRADTERVTSLNVLAWRLKNHRLVNKSGVSLNRFLI
ncbi:UNVERIFIED_CONTAM: hypothetical protein Sradi_6924300 [Sesamum radiatum]|uniref:Myb/SANT-like domain-containing protein n=1 Tax=Sesamum radiatum TaxID=300843 RepID=A0AAW2JGC4_SESRA